MERVLATGASNIGKAGVATMVYRWGQEFNSKEIVYDYLMQNGTPDVQYIGNIERKGGKIFTLDWNEKKGVLRIIRWVTDILYKNHYRTIHINADSAYLAAGYIYAAKRAGVRNIIVHSHCSQIDENNTVKRMIKILLHKFCRPYVLKNAKYYLSCSTEAGLWMYGKKGIKNDKYHVIYTSERVQDFVYSEDERNSFRKEFNLDEKIIIGNIGRFSYQKNHEFLIKVFCEFKKKHSTATLVLVGTGPLKNKIMSMVNELGLNDCVIFLQDRNDIRAIYSAMDVFVMTSFFEGMPATLVEAQMSFLPCVVFEKVTHDVKFTENVQFLNTWEIPRWVESIEHYIGANRNIDRLQLYQSDFNIINASKKLSHYLLK